MRKLIITILLITTFYNVYGQELSLSDLENICNKTNWEYVNQYLMNKGWEYYDSEKGSSTKYNTITWSFNKSSYNDEAQAWFYLYIYEGLPNKISYLVINKPSYTIIQNTLGAKGYKLSDSKIEDNEIISNYSNSKFILKITTEKRKKDEDYSYYDKSITAYSFLFIKKWGIYDSDNGKKTDYWYGGDKKKVEYTLKNGQIHGTMKKYYYNGQLKSTGEYSNGKENGKFYEYDESGNKVYECTQKKGKLDGVFTAYEDGRKSITITYKNGIKQGWNNEYVYDDEGNLLLKYSGSYSNDLQIGKWTLVVIKEGKEEIAEFTTYNNGVKNGAFKEIQGDSLIYGSYRNDLLNGKYSIHSDMNKMLFSGIIETDTSKLLKFVVGEYSNGKKSGHWWYFAFGNLKEDGKYYNDNRTGTWYTYKIWQNKNGKKFVPSQNDNGFYKGSLIAKTEYRNGMRNGKAFIYGYTDEYRAVCNEKDAKQYKSDSCTYYKFVRINLTSEYENDELNGISIHKDSLGNIIKQGTYLNGKRNGKWTEYYKDEDDKMKLEATYKDDNLDGAYVLFNDKDKIQTKGLYRSGKKTGIWSYYKSDGKIEREKSYLNGELEGISKIYNDTGFVSVSYEYRQGDLKGVTKYIDNVENEEFIKHKILSKTNSYYISEITIDDRDTTKVETQRIKNDMPYNWYSLGVKHGPYKIYVKNELYIDGTFYEGLKAGVWKYYYPNQSVHIEINYNYDIIFVYKETYFDFNTSELYSGQFTYWNNDRTIKEVRTINKGYRNGKTIYYDSDNEIIKKEKYKDGVLK